MLATLGLPAHAQSDTRSAFAPSGVFVQGGKVAHTDSATIGLTWDTPVHWQLGTVGISLYGEASIAEWSYATQQEGRQKLTQLAAVPVFRFRGDQGTSPWFVDAAVGLSVMNHNYNDGRKHFSTAFNFADHLGVGYDFGAQRQHEVQLRVEHFSNGGIDEPNPGKTFGQVRYVYRFP